MVEGSLSGRGLSEAAYLSIMNRGRVDDAGRLPPARRSTLRCRWQAHLETLRRGAQRIAQEIRAQRAIERWPLGKTYWLQLLLAEHSGYRALEERLGSELAALDT